jgi:hypothetical protein
MATVLFIQSSHHSAAEHRASTRILHRTLFFASLLISAQLLFTSLASSSTVLRHVFFGLPLPRLPWGFQSRACLVMSSVDFRSVWPSHPHLRFLICKSILGCFVRFHNSLFVIWSGQKILRIFLRLLLIKTCSLVVIYFETVLIIYSKYNFGVLLCLPYGKSNFLCSANGLHSHGTWLHCGRAPRWVFIPRWAYRPLEHLYRQKPNKSGDRSSFSHIASCYLG